MLHDSPLRIHIFRCFCSFFPVGSATLYNYFVKIHRYSSFFLCAQNGGKANTFRGIYFMKGESRKENPTFVCNQIFAQISGIFDVIKFDCLLVKDFIHISPPKKTSNSFPLGFDEKFLPKQTNLSQNVIMSW